MGTTGCIAFECIIICYRGYSKLSFTKTQNTSQSNSPRDKDHNKQVKIKEVDLETIDEFKGKDIGQIQEESVENDESEMNSPLK